MQSHPYRQGSAPYPPPTNPLSAWSRPPNPHNTSSSSSLSSYINFDHTRSLSAGQTTANPADIMAEMDDPVEQDNQDRHEGEHMVYKTSDTKRSKKEPGGKKIRACIYCRRSHMECDMERPCKRCVRRGITDLCREDAMAALKQREVQHAKTLKSADAVVTFRSGRSESTSAESAQYDIASYSQSHNNIGNQGMDVDSAKMMISGANSQSLYNSVGAAGPAATGTRAARSASLNAGGAEGGGEFGALSDYLESLGIPSLPGGLGDIFGETMAGVVNPFGSNSNAEASTSYIPPNLSGETDNPVDDVMAGNQIQDWGIDWNPVEAPTMGMRVREKAKDRFEEDLKPLLLEANKTERFYLTAADQQSGTRDERLKNVIRAKFEAGLLKPYDYARGYARMYRWLEGNVSSSSIQAILRPMSIFRPAFRAIAQSLSDIDLILVEESFERLMLDYDRVFSAIHTPACLWRRTGEMYKGNKEMSLLTGISSAWFRGGNMGIFQLMDEESIVKYYQLFGSIAFDTKTKSVNTVCTLRIPHNLTKSGPPHASTQVNTSSTSPVIGPAPTHPTAVSTFVSPVSSPPTVLGNGMNAAPGLPSLSLGQASMMSQSVRGPRLIRCAFNFTVRRDSWGMPIAIIGNFIPL